MDRRYRKISPPIGLVELSFTNDQVLIDVRTKEEIQAAPLFDNSIHLDVLSVDFKDHLKSLDKIRPYFIICQTGKRGQMACEIMAKIGFMNLVYIDGGKDGWDEYFSKKNNK